MITIREDIPTKVTGITSLYISSDVYDSSISDIIRNNCELVDYNKKTKTWEIPLNNISQLLYDFCEKYDVDIIEYVDDKNSIQTKFDSTEYKIQPFDYQAVGIEYGLNKNKWMLLDDQGLGKTLQMIYLANELKKRGEIEHCLVVCCVDSLRTNWKKEIKKFTDLSCVILGESYNSKGNYVYKPVIDRAKQLQETIDEFFIITTITTLRSDDVINSFLTSKNKIDMIVVDEGHKVKDINSIGGKNLLKLNAKYKVFMTGSLIVNDPLDCYMGLKWIDTEHSTLTNFKKYYCVFNEVFKQYDGYKNIDFLKEEISSCSLRRLKDDVLDLPPKNIIDEYVDMSSDHSKLYLDVVSGVKSEIDLVNISTNNLLGMIVRLRQATSCPQILTSKHINSSKVERCIELVRDLVSKGEKVVVFSSFKECIYNLSNEILDLCPLVVTGDTDDLTTSTSIDKFQGNDDSKVILATWQKLGTGVTLNRARYMIFIDCPWTSSDYRQACDRIYRIGTTKPVFIYNLICVNTIDERVNSLINYKKALSDFIVDDKVENEKALDNLRKYIQEL